MGGVHGRIDSVNAFATPLSTGDAAVPSQTMNQRSLPLPTAAAQIWPGSLAASSNLTS
ncbi:Uncharacterised protein [Mycobacteroides abscessus subsp. abscessus]|nr:Uncharacterised protein [Mycobacteroides abscessus subsp. abscessus]